MEQSSCRCVGFHDFEVFLVSEGLHDPKIFSHFVLGFVFSMDDEEETR